MFSMQFIREVGWWPFLWRLAWRQFNKRVLARGVMVRLPTGLSMEAPPWSHSASEVVYTAANMDWGSERLLIENLDHEETFLDIGAHVGYYALYAAPKVAKVYAFEPDDQSFAALVKNSKSCGYVEPVHKAVYSSSGRMQLFKRRDMVGFAYLDITTNPTMENAGVIEAVTVDDWMRDRPDERVTGIKIDIDGLDLEVVKGAASTITRDQPLVLMEFMRTETNNANDLYRFAQSSGYDIFAFHTRGNGIFTFGRIGPDIFEDVNVKMIFLTPPRLVERFLRRCD